MNELRLPAFLRPPPSASRRGEFRHELTVLMPCLNEAETLAVCIRKAKALPCWPSGGRWPRC